MSLEDIDERRPGMATGGRSGWKQDPAAVRKDILRVATAEFSRCGLSGARIEDIAAKTATSKRMIYYYFKDKAGLYRHVLEQAYAKVRQEEAKLNLDGLAPVEALRRLVEFTFDHHSRNPDFIRLVMIENIHHGENLAQSSVIAEVNEQAIKTLSQITARGAAAGVFRSGISALDLHWMISSLSFFNVSNRYTFSQIFGPKLLSKDGQKALREQVVDMVLRFATID